MNLGGKQDDLRFDNNLLYKWIVVKFTDGVSVVFQSILPVEKEERAKALKSYNRKYGKEGIIESYNEYDK